MNVRELRAALDGLPDDLPVLVTGYEGGMTNADSLKLTSVIEDTSEVWYYGNYSYSNAAGSTPAVYIGGEHHSVDAGED